MSFDLYLNKRVEKIDLYEEEIFKLINEDENYPTLNWIWEEFYNGPRISPNQAHLIVHELLYLLDRLPNKDEYIIARNLIIRLLPFFNEAYMNNVSIKTASD